ncbi:unnamed protein product [Ascophyllum nodosum]
MAPLTGGALSNFQPSNSGNGQQSTVIHFGASISKVRMGVRRLFSKFRKLSFRPTLTTVESKLLLDYIQCGVSPGPQHTPQSNKTVQRQPLPRSYPYGAPRSDWPPGVVPHRVGARAVGRRWRLLRRRESRGRRGVGGRWRGARRQRLR